MKKLVLLRHGQSRWNQENRFTGWFDVELYKKGEEEAINAARLLQKEGYSFDIAFTSLLKRAIKTLWLVMEEMDLMWIPVHRTWKLNERHYGALQGLNKTETVDKHGVDQVKLWRRSYDISPPPISPESEFYPGKDPRYSTLTKEEIPLTECLKDTINRFLPYWHETIVPQLKEGKKVIIVAHGNSLRGLVKYLDQISDNEIGKLNIPTGIPLIYELEEDLSPIRSFYLGDPDKAKKGSQLVADQEKKTK